MNSLVLRTTALLLISLLLIFSIVLLVRGHDNPGGGFSGGLVATISWALYSLAFGAAATRRAVRFGPRYMTGIGLLLSVASGAIPTVLGKPYLTGLWIFHIGTPLLFDLGVYLIIQGTALNIILCLEEEE